jgi:hypothetical protein
MCALTALQLLILKLRPIQWENAAAVLHGFEYGAGDRFDIAAQQGF